MHARELVRSLFAWSLALPVTAGAAVVARATPRAADPAAHRVARVWARTVLLLAGIRVRLDGALPAADDAMIVISNHRSRLDIPVLYACLPAAARTGFWAKSSLFRLPLLGPAMRRLGCEPVDRADRRRAPELLRRGREALSGGRWMVVFPEETWSETGELLPFQRGAFLLARRSGVPLLPVAVIGTGAACGGAGLTVRSGSVVVRTGPVIRPSDEPDHEALSARARAEIEALMQAEDRR